MKKSHLWIAGFWAVVIGIKIWAGFSGQTTAADQILEASGFALMLIGTLACAAFGELNKRRFVKLGVERAAQDLHMHNYFAILGQGILLMVWGFFLLFLKWWLAAAISIFFLVPVIWLFTRGWPSFRLRADAVARSVQKSRAEFRFKKTQSDSRIS